MNETALALVIVRNVRGHVEANALPRPFCPWPSLRLDSVLVFEERILDALAGTGGAA